MDEISSPDYEFGGFHLDTAQQVLVSPAGEPLPLPSRAFATLRYLVERAGEIVDKSALMSTVWPTTVVAENNLNQCILALRKTLGESAGERRFILTVPGRGYKFVAPVTVVQHRLSRRASQLSESAAPASMVAAASDPGWYRKYRVAIASGVMVIVVVGAALWLWSSRGRAVTSPAEYVQLTDVTDTATVPVLSPDGRMLAFIRNGDWFLSSGQIWLKMLPDGEPVKLTDAPPGPIFGPTFSPDSTKVLYTVADLKLVSWDTWSVPVTGGAAATRVLPNASGLTYIGPHQVMYSEFKQGVHLGIVASMEDRSVHREIYLPSHERGMAHFSYLSPDRKSVLVVEMGPTGVFGGCRLVPFDGSSPGYIVGPPGSCLSAAWSPDGVWMYFSVNTFGHTHLWRQRSPHGEPQQITFGPNDEETVFAAPDGQSLVTSIGVNHSTLWFHNGNGERLLTKEGQAFSPQISADAHRVYFLTSQNSTMNFGLSRLDMDTGNQQSLLPDFIVFEYEISPDEQQVVFTTVRDGGAQIWVAPLDRGTPPKLLVRGGDQPAFGGGHVFFRKIGEHANYLHRINLDGSGDIQLLPQSINNFWAVAPDGKCVVIDHAIEGPVMAAWVAPLDGHTAPRMIGKGYWPSRWSHDGRTLYVQVGVMDHLTYVAKTAALPTGPDDLPLGELPPPEPNTALLPISVEGVSMSEDPSVYAFLKSDLHRNIYRIPLH
jgi:DNA-binding winged helix-turn-helix (wHTH) protein/Tol biopolymer transport system component